MKKTAKYCMNCNNPVEGQFCSNCGQSIKTKRLTNKYVFVEMPLSIFDLDKRFPYTIKSLIFHPVKTAKEYLEGKRIKYYRPISLMLLLVSLNILMIKLLISDELRYKGLSHEMIKTAKSTERIIMNYPSLFFLFTLPFVALAFYWAFKKYKYNYAEFLYINVFLFSFQTIVFTYLFNIYQFLILKYTSYSMMSYIIMIPSLGISFIFYIFFFYHFFKDQEKNKLKLILRSLLGIILLIIIIIIFSFLFAFIVFLIMYIHNKLLAYF